MDYNFENHNVTFKAGSTSASFNVSIIDDSINEKNEIFYLYMLPLFNCIWTTPPYYHYYGINHSYVPVEIVDDDDSCK